MKKTILIAIFVLVCNCSPILATDALHPDAEVSNNETTTVSEPVADIKADIVLTKPKFEHLKEGTKNVLLAGQEIAAQVFTKDNLLLGIVYIAGACYVTLSIACDIILGVCQLTKWAVTTLVSFVR